MYFGADLPLDSHNKMFSYAGPVPFYSSLNPSQTILKFYLYALNSGQDITPRAIICPSFDTVIAHHAT